MKQDRDAHMENERNILEIRNLRVSFPSGKHPSSAVNGMTLSLEEGCILGLVGESGCGKSVTSLSILGLNDKAESEGSILFRRKDGSVIDMLSSDEKERQKLRGSEIAMIFQEPGSALNPVLRIGKQLERVIRLHDRTLTRQERKSKAIELLQKAGFPEPGKIAHMFPHELSGGMKQRVVIAMALSSGPELILADEPTTALDATIQNEILRLLESLVRENGVSMILISHDLGVISRMSDRIAIMWHGMLMEEGLKDEILSSPVHPYTKKLLRMARNMEESLEGDDREDESVSEASFPCPFFRNCSSSGRKCSEWTPDYIHVTPTHRVSCMNIEGRMSHE